MNTKGFSKIARVEAVEYPSFEEYGCERIVCIACGNSVFQSKGSKKLSICPQCGLRFIHPKHLSEHLAGIPVKIEVVQK